MRTAVQVRRVVFALPFLTELTLVCQIFKRKAETAANVGGVVPTSRRRAMRPWHSCRPNIERRSELKVCSQVVLTSKVPKALGGYQRRDTKIPNDIEVIGTIRG